eukprot:s169_g5.t1
MEKASNVKETDLEVQEALLEKAKALSERGNPASREELMNAMLHYFLGAGVDEEEIGDLSLEKMPIPKLWSCRRWSCASSHMQVHVCGSHCQPWQLHTGQKADSSVGLLTAPRV